MAGMRDLVEDIAKALVDIPEEVAVREVQESRPRCSNYASRLAIWEK